MTLWGSSALQYLLMHHNQSSQDKGLPGQGNGDLYREASFGSNMKSSDVGEGDRQKNHGVMNLFLTGGARRRGQGSCRGESVDRRFTGFGIVEQKSGIK